MNELCDENGNCDLFLFRKLNNQWLMLELPLHAWVGSFALVPPEHNGLKELVIAETLSAKESQNTVLQYDGKQYVLKKVYVCRYTNTDVACKEKQ